MASLILSDKPIKPFLIHGASLVAIWYLPGLMYVLNGIAALPDPVRAVGQHALAVAMLSLTMISLIAAIRRRKGALRTA